MSLTLGWSLATSPGASCSLAVGRGGGSGATSAQSRPELTPGDPLPCLHPSYCNLVLLVTPNPVLLQSTLGTFFSKLTCFIQGNYRVKIWRQALLSAVGRGRRIRTQAPQGLRRPRGREHPQLWVVSARCSGTPARRRSPRSSLATFLEFPMPVLIVGYMGLVCWGVKILVLDIWGL